MNWKMVGLVVVLAAVLGVSYIASQQFLRTQVATPPDSPGSPTAVGEEVLSSGPAVVITDRAIGRTTPEQYACILAALTPAAAPPVVAPAAALPAAEAEPATPPEQPATVSVEQAPAPAASPAAITSQSPTSTPTPPPSSPLPSDGSTLGVTTDTATKAILGCLNLPNELTAKITSASLVIPPRLTTLTGSPPPGGQTVDRLYHWVEFSLQQQGFEIAVNNTKDLKALPIEPSLYRASPEEAVDIRFQRLQQQQEVTPAHTEALAQLKETITFLERELEVVEPVHIVQITALPNDPYISSRGAWGQDYNDLWGLQSIQAPEAWNVTTGSPTTVVAVVDTGLDFFHPDMQGNIWENPGEIGTDTAGKNKKTNGIDDDGNSYIDDWRGWDFANNDNDPMDDEGHGTHVSGTIAARGNNGIGITGVMWQAKIMVAKFLDSDGSGLSTDGAKALEYIANQKARIVNNSWGSSSNSAIIHDAIQHAALRSNVVVIAAAGNSGDDSPEFPGSYPEVISVGAITTDDNRADFSTYGETLDIMAPGGNSTDESEDRSYNNILSLRSSFATYPSSLTVGGNLARLRGTSMASPHVAGVAGLVVSRHPDWNAEEVRSALLLTADDLGISGEDSDTGVGKVNAARSLTISSPPYVTADIISPARETYFSAAQTVEIRGTAKGRPFARYAIDVGKGSNPDSWSATNISLVGGGTSEVENGLLARWNIRPLVSAPDFYTIRLTVYLADNTKRVYSTRVIVDTSVRPGWPVVSDLMAPVVPAVGNIVGDSKKEIVLHYPYEELLQLYDTEGREQTGGGWPKSFAGGEWTQVTIANITGDEHEEILIEKHIDKQPTTLSVYDGTLGSAPLWSIQTASANEYISQRPVVFDVDGNGDREVFFYTVDIGPIGMEGYGVLKIYRVEHDGTVAVGWPKVVSNPNQPYIWCNACSPIVPYDINNDGALEMFFFTKTYFRPPFTSYDGHTSALYALNGEGELLPGYPKQLSIPQGLHYPVTSLLIGDVKGDSQSEVIFVKSGKDSDRRTERLTELYFIDANGNESVIPILGHRIFGTNSFNDSAHGPVLHDVDRDGKKDIVLGHHVIKGDGTSPAGWPTPDADGKEECVESWCGPAMNTWGGVALADVGGSEDVDILTAPEWDSSGTLPPASYIAALSLSGSSVPGWPKPLARFLDPWYNPLAADLDQNGSMEVLAELWSGDVVIWNTQGKPAAGEWPLLHHNEQHHRWLTQKPAVSTTPTPPVPTTTVSVPACAQLNLSAFALLDVNPKNGVLTLAEVDPIITRVQNLLNNCANNSCYAGNEQYDLTKDGRLTALDVLQLINMRNSCIKQ